MEGYSAKVNLRLEVNGVMHSLSHVGGGHRIIFKELPAPLPPCNGVLHIDVDENHEAIPVYLPNGVQAIREWVKYEKGHREGA